MTPRDLDALLEALQWDARARGADRLVLEVADGPCARCWRADEVLHRRPVDWRVFGALARRAVIGAGLDPWQFRRPQAAAEKGGWLVAVDGDTIETRRVSFRPAEARAAPAGSEGRADAILRALEQQVNAATQIEEVGDAVATPLVKLANLVLRDAHVRDVRRISATIDGAELTYADGTTEHRFRWPPELWPDLRRRWIHMAQFDPWERGPAMAYLHLRIGGADQAVWSVEVLPEGQQGQVVMTMVSVQRASDRRDPPAVAPAGPALDPGLSAVLDAPDDLARRGVWADVLLERGDPRGKFINLQLGGRGTDGRPPPESLAWCGALRGIPGEVRFAWGFVDRVVVSHPGLRLDWDAIARDPHWATVRGLKLSHPLPEAGSRVLAEARLRSLEALTFAVAPTQPVPAPVLDRITALGLIGMSDRSARWVAAQPLPKLTSIELALDEDLRDDAVPRFFALAATRPVPDLIVDARAHAAVWPLLGRLPAAVERVTLAPSSSELFPSAVACTLRRNAAFDEAVLHADVDTLYRGAPDVFTRLAALPTLSIVRLVAADRALDRGRLAVLARTCAAALPRVRLEAGVGPPAARLWWLAGTPAR